MLTGCFSCFDSFSAEWSHGGNGVRVGSRVGLWGCATPSPHTQYLSIEILHEAGVFQLAQETVVQKIFGLERARLGIRRRVHESLQRNSVYVRYPLPGRQESAVSLLREFQGGDLGVFRDDRLRYSGLLPADLQFFPSNFFTSAVKAGMISNASPTMP